MSMLCWHRWKDESRDSVNGVNLSEAWLMELLVDEEADNERIPDDGQLEGSGDDFERGMNI